MAEQTQKQDVFVDQEDPRCLHTTRSATGLRLQRRSHQVKERAKRLWGEFGKASRRGRAPSDGVMATPTQACVSGGFSRVSLAGWWPVKLTGW